MSMRKITYYENILEFKEKTKEQLNLNEINNWQLCRTCLADSSDEDVNMETTCIIDVTQENFLSVKEMVSKTTNIKIAADENLPLRVCKECFGKISSIYYFSIQVHKAENVLQRISNKLQGFQNVSQVCEPEDKHTEDEDTLEDSFTIDLGENSNISAAEKENFSELLEERSADIKENSEWLEEISGTKAVLLKDADYFSDENIDFVKEESLLEKEDGTLDFADEENQEIINDISGDTITTISIEKVSYKSKNPTRKAQAKGNSEWLEEISEYKTVITKDSAAFSNDKIHFDEEEEDSLLDKAELSEFADEEEEETANDASADTIITTSIEKIQHKSKNLKKRCNTNTSTPAYRHKQPRVSSPLLINFTCAICQHAFDRQLDLVLHVKESHPNSKAFTCRVCNNLFSHIQSLSRHMNSHKKTLVLNECEFCPKTFVRADDLKRHLRVHTGERPYVCSICEKSFQQQFALKTHEERHLYESAHFRPRNFKCTVCEQTYISRNGLYLHKRKHHSQNETYQELPHRSLNEKSDRSLN